MPILAQAVGILAMVFSCLSFQMKSRRGILVMQTVCAFLFAVHYGMLGALTGCVLNGVAVVRDVIFMNRDKKFFGSDIWTILFCVLMVVIGAFSWQNWFSLIFIVAMVLNTLSMAMKNPQGVRKVILFSSPLILIYSILTSSIGGVLNEIFSLSSNIVALIRYGRKKEE